MRYPIRMWPTAGTAIGAAAVLGAMIALGAMQSAHAASAPGATSPPGATKSTAAPAASAATAPSSEDDKTLYALGVFLSRNLDTFNLSSAEFKRVQAGFVDGFNHHASVDPQGYEVKLQTLQRTRLAAIDEHQKTIGKAYLDKAAALPGAQKTASGMVYIPLTPGTGPTPDRSDRVNVNYEGKLVDGTVFDSSAKHGGQPITLNVGGIIPCWTEALQLMKVGGKSHIVCPSTVAYGDRGQPPVIMPGSTLDFSIELVEILPKAATPAPGTPGAASPPAGTNSGGTN